MRTRDARSTYRPALADEKREVQRFQIPREHPMRLGLYLQGIRGLKSYTVERLVRSLAQVRPVPQGPMPVRTCTEKPEAMMVPL